MILHHHTSRTIQTVWQNSSYQNDLRKYDIIWHYVWLRQLQKSSFIVEHPTSSNAKWQLQLYTIHHCLKCAGISWMRKLKTLINFARLRYFFRLFRTFCFPVFIGSPILDGVNPCKLQRPTAPHHATSLPRCFSATMHAKRSSKVPTVVKRCTSTVWCCPRRCAPHDAAGVTGGLPGPTCCGDKGLEKARGR